MYPWCTQRHMRPPVIAKSCTLLGRFKVGLCYPTFPSPRAYLNGNHCSSPNVHILATQHAAGRWRETFGDAWQSSMCTQHDCFLEWLAVRKIVHADFYRRHIGLLDEDMQLQRWRDSTSGRPTGDPPDHDRTCRPACLQKVRYKLYQAGGVGKLFPGDIVRSSLRQIQVHADRWRQAQQPLPPCAGAVVDVHC